MAPFDRETALKTAEKALRQGRIDAAIADYHRIVEALPRDWNSANVLGDLLVRANQVDKGIAQYTRIADHLAHEGFYPKAAALYKKVLKVRPSDEYALLQSGEVATKQGLLADAKNAFKTVADARAGRGDTKGAAEMHIRIGTLDPDDLDARLGAARAASGIGDLVTALREYREVAVKLDGQGRSSEALPVFQLAYEIDPADTKIRERLLDGYLDGGNVDQARAVASGPAELKRVASSLEAAGRTADFVAVLEEVAALDPGDLQVRAGLAQTCAAMGDLDKARQYLSAETAGTSAPLWLILAEVELSAGHAEAGRAAVVRALSLDPSQREAAVVLGCRLSDMSGDAGYPCLDAVADHALAENDFVAAAAALREFVSRVRHHVVALMRLVEICVDGRIEATMNEAQSQLADAYLESGRALEASIISEDLVAREPWNSDNIERFRRALVLLGEADPDTVIADRLSGDSPFLATDKLDLNEGVFFDGEPADASLDSPASDDGPLAVEPQDGTSPASPGQGSWPLRHDVTRDPEEEAAAEQYSLALTYKELGMLDDAIEALESAVTSPRQRFDAAALLGQLYMDEGDTLRALEWYERAAAAPAPSADAGHALLYDLARGLERVGEQARALAVFLELEAESGGYRDVSSRIENLAKAQAKG